MNETIIIGLIEVLQTLIKNHKESIRELEDAIKALQEQLEQCR